MTFSFHSLITDKCLCHIKFLFHSQGITCATKKSINLIIFTWILYLYQVKSAIICLYLNTFCVYYNSKIVDSRLRTTFRKNELNYFSLDFLRNIILIINLNLHINNNKVLWYIFEISNFCIYYIYYAYSWWWKYHKVEHRVFYVYSIILLLKKNQFRGRLLIT